MKERPILFSASMVRAILDGRKTQTRRIVKPQPTITSFAWLWVKNAVRLEWGELASPAKLVAHCPYGQPGDQLWVRETFCPTPDFGFAYRASTDSEGERCRRELGLKWKPSIHMPRRTSRITLEVTAVRVEMLQCITNDGAIAEGIPYQPPKSWLGGGWREKAAFVDLWESINGRGSWDSNPWVWVVTFKRITP